MIIVADTSPINYLVLIGLQDILPTLFGQIIIPEGVLAELQAPATPSVVGQWIANRPLNNFSLNATREEKLNNPNYSGDPDEALNAQLDET